MKLAIFSDIHGNLEALTAIIDDIKNKEITEIYALGDTIAIGPSSKLCLDTIVRERIRMTKGNHEMYYLIGTEHYNDMSENEAKHHKWIRMQLNEHSKRFVESCPLEYTYEAHEKQIKMMHFAHDGVDFVNSADLKDISVMYPESGYLIVYGHEHGGTELKEVNQTHYLGLGSSGCRKDNQTFYTIVELTDAGFNIEKIWVTYNRDQFLNKMKSIEYPEKDFVSRIFFGIEEGE